MTVYSENILFCIAVPLIVVLFFIRGNARRFVLSFLVGMAVCLLSSYIGGFFGTAGEMDARETAIFISPIVEELMKLLPLLFIFIVFKPTSHALFLAAAGLGAGFATFENCCYLLSSQNTSLAFTAIRGLAVGVMHIVCILVLALSLLIIRRYEAYSFAAIVGAVSLSMTFHALYNLLVSGEGASPYIGFVLPLFTAVLIYLPCRKLLSEEQNGAKN